jgi:hypothetical protein
MDMDEEEEDLNLAASGDSLINLLQAGSFGPQFKAVLERMLIALEPHAAMGDPNAKEKVFSYKARVKMTGETKRLVANAYDDLHEALFLDRKISFKKPVESTETIKVESEMPCTCGMLVQVVQKCPHFNDQHGKILKEAASFEDKRIYDKTMVSRLVQTDRQLSPTRSVSSSHSEDKAPSRDGSFSRGRGRGRREDSNRRVSADRNNNNRPRKKSRDRSRSAFKIDNRDRSRDSDKKSRDFSRGRLDFKRPSQPAQDRLNAERRKMEEADNRKKAEEVASKAKKEADRLSALLARPQALSRRRAGDSALGADGQIAWETCPEVKAPPGMKPVITVKSGVWDVVLEPKSD